MNMTYRIIDPREGDCLETGEFNVDDRDDRRRIGRLRSRAARKGMIFAQLPTTAALSLRDRPFASINDATVAGFGEGDTDAND